ncbi:hypothetical protein ACSBR1_039977 [Camellia fascicularis]
MGRGRERKRKIERWKEREIADHRNPAMGENYSVLEKLREIEREMGELEKTREMDITSPSLGEWMLEREKKIEREMGELEKQIQRFEWEMGENYSILEKLNHLMISKACNLTADQVDHIDSFYHRLRFLTIILKDMDEKQQQQHELNYEAENLPMQIYYVICKTRQLIRSFDVEVPGQRDSYNNGDNFFHSLIGTNIMEEIKPIEAKVVQFYDQINQIQLLQDAKSFNDGVHSSVSMSMENRTMVEEEITVGFDDEALTIKELLAGGKKQLQMISIVGMPGLGKTTLATKLYNDPYITHYFHIRAWTYASQLPRKTDMLLDILRSLNVDEIENMTNEKLGEKLYKQLKGKRYLIVIDDLWDIGAWVDLKTYFPNDNNGSRVMFTSRLKEMAMHASPDCHPHCLRFLTEEESWELLQRKVFQNESCPPELIEIGKQIMKKCEGLPLAIVIIAGLLAKNIKTQESWIQVAQSVSSYIVSDPNQYLDTLALSYNQLPRHLKPCFLYLGAFPEDREIPVQELIWLWIAEGFIQKRGQKSLEEVAEDYLMDLIQRSLVIVAQKRLDGRIKACRMHDLLRDLCLKKARENNFLQWTHNYKDASPSSSSNYETNNPRHLCILSYFGPRFDHILLQAYAPTVQSLLCFRHEFKEIICFDDSLLGDMCSFICWTFKLLRVLQTCYHYAFFPRELTQLVNLRYLAINLRGSCELPPSISNLSNLETLIMNSEWKSIYVILPCDVWKIPKLRHLYAKGQAKYAFLCYEEAVMDHKHPSILENLRTIANLNCHGFIQGLLARTPFLTKLGICGQLFSDSGNWMFLNLEFLRHLETLKLHSIVRPRYPTTLREVKFPTNVKRLTMKGTRIEWEEISVLGMMLPNLELLKLEDDAAWGQQWATTDGGFPRLKFLKLKDLNVKQWITCSSHFPSLQHLLLDGSISLEEIPSSLGDILTLQMIEVNCRDFTVVESVWKIKEEQESIGNNLLKVLIPKYSWGLSQRVKIQLLEISRRKMRNATSQ